ncbi:MAG: hypothetical protein ACLQU1_42915 [Bryobacteraceae bacterium]
MKIPNYGRQQARQFREFALPDGLGDYQEIVGSIAADRSLTGRSLGRAPMRFQSRAQGAPRKGAVGTVVSEQTLGGEGAL